MWRLSRSSAIHSFAANQLAVQVVLAIGLAFQPDWICLIIPASWVRRGWVGQSSSSTSKSLDFQRSWFALPYYPHPPLFGCSDFPPVWVASNPNREQVTNKSRPCFLERTFFQTSRLLLPTWLRRLIVQSISSDTSTEETFDSRDFQLNTCMLFSLAASAMPPC